MDYRTTAHSHQIDICFPTLRRFITTLTSWYACYWPRSLSLYWFDPMYYLTGRKLILFIFFEHSCVLRYPTTTVTYGSESETRKRYIQKWSLLIVCYTCYCWFFYINRRRNCIYPCSQNVPELRFSFVSIFSHMSPYSRGKRKKKHRSMCLFFTKLSIKIPHITIYWILCELCPFDNTRHN